LGREAKENMTEPDWLAETPLVADAPFYFPLTERGYEVKPGFYRLGTDLGNGARDGQLFQLDSGFAAWRQSKEKAREEALHKYWCTERFAPELASTIARSIVGQLLAEYPGVFRLEKGDGLSKLHCQHTQEILCFDDAMQLVPAQTTQHSDIPYADAFDALACQVQEDLAIICRAGERNWLAAAHLCSANHWAAADKVGRDFAAVHAPVAAMEALNARAASLVAAMIDKGPYMRFAWGLSTDTRLNHHPQPPPGIDINLWRGRRFAGATSHLYMRVERQVLWGFAEIDAALFTIRTYFVDCAQLDHRQRVLLMAALQTMSTEVLVYKGLRESRDEMLDWLRTNT
jgi:dimethylamine monooxygenase subunit A